MLKLELSGPQYFDLLRTATKVVYDIVDVRSFILNPIVLGKSHTSSRSYLTGTHFQDPKYGREGRLKRQSSLGSRL